MRLKSLELIGFKSFVDRTTVTFDDGITSIVGPNGAGKSNIVDAIRWVLGEQSAKHLRGSEMSDIIFSGSEARPATGMASVFLTFDNADGRAPAEYANYSEITIGRRLYRSGESEYYINKVPCRLKDIIEFFLGTGVGTKAYSIVQQGQVERIVSAKPEERRALLEEAAGISKFKMHRDSALRKIEATKQNLARLADIITELEHQKNSLSRQAKKAERYKLFADELKDLELSHASHQFRKLKEELSSIGTKLAALSEDEASKGALVSNEETQIDSARIEMAETERKLNGMQEHIYELQNRMRLNESELKFKADQLASIRSRCENDTKEIGELKTKLGSVATELDGMNSNKVNIDIELASFEEVTGAIQKKAADVQALLDDAVAAIDGMRQEFFESVKGISDAKARLEQLERQEIDISGKVAKDQTEIDAIDKKIAEIEANIAASQGTLNGMKGSREAAGADLVSLTSETERLRSELQHSESSFLNLSQTSSIKKSRLTSLEELRANFEGFHDGVRAVLKRKSESNEFSGVYGTISEVIETEPSYETAVSAALGEKLQYVIVKSHQEGVEAIDYLKAVEAGRSTFVPLEMREVDETPTPSGEGVIGPLTNYVRFTDDYKKIGKYLFSDIVLVEDLQKGLKVWQGNGHKKTLVTLDGDLIDPHGVVSGGSGGDVSRQFLEKRREIAELQIDVERLGREVEAGNIKLGELRNRVQVNEARITQLKTQVHSQDVEFVHKERDVMGMNQDVTNWRRMRDRLTVETAALAEEREAGSKERAALLENVATFESRHNELEAEIARRTSESESLKRDLKAISEEMTASKVQLASAQEQSAGLEREIKRLSDYTGDIDSSIEAKYADITECNLEIEANELTTETAKNEVARLVQEIDTVSKEQNTTKLTYDSSLEALRGRELALREVRKAFEEIKKQTYELKLEETRVQEKVFYLEREIQEKYHLDLATRHEEFKLDESGRGDPQRSPAIRAGAEPRPYEASVEEEVQTRIHNLKDKLEKIGTVSSDAITEYQSVFERYEFLSKQSEDLKSSIEALQRAIIRINRTSKERFFETFNAVNDRFKMLFPRLFHGGGKAELILLDQENVLESGIEIVAQPPGKKLQNVDLLSGGEKALVAITFIFSIFLIKPSPFCLLDEVDAPLDDANIDRFNQLVREMSKLSQFITITHNRRTMELADTLYGVTMEEAGISKIVSVRLEGSKKAGEESTEASVAA